MKKYLVLTGTTGFPLLEQSILEMAKSDENIEFILQTKNELSNTKNVAHQKFIDLESFDTSELSGIIGHCGAGTTFWALAKATPYLAVIDLTREDDHQKDLGGWLSDNKYAYVVESRPLTLSDLTLLGTESFNKYEKDSFKIKYLTDFL